MNPSRATIPLMRPHQCDSDGGRIRGVLLYYNLSNLFESSCNLLTITVALLYFYAVYLLGFNVSSFNFF